MNRGVSVVMTKKLLARVRAAAEAEAERTGVGVSSSRWIREAIEMRLAGKHRKGATVKRAVSVPPTPEELESREEKFARALAEARKKRGAGG